jgi:hypothetical protein
MKYVWLFLIVVIGSLIFAYRFFKTLIIAPSLSFEDRVELMKQMYE